MSQLQGNQHRLPQPAAPPLASIARPTWSSGPRDDEDEDFPPVRHIPNREPSPVEDQPFVEPRYDPLREPSWE